MRRKGLVFAAPVPAGVEPAGSGLADRMVAPGCDAAARRLG